MAVLADGGVGAVTVTNPTVHPVDVTAGELREFFLDDHKHMALIADRCRLVTTVERGDLQPDLSDDHPARLLGTLEGRVVSVQTSAAGTLASMRARGRRRLAVVDEAGGLVGLLCLKRSDRGFCADADVASRRLMPSLHLGGSVAAQRAGDCSSP